MHWTLKPLPPGSGQFVIAYYLGYYWDWVGNVDAAVAAVDMTTLTHLVLALYAPGGGEAGGSPGDLIPRSGTFHTSGCETGLIAKAHDNSRKVLMMLGGAGMGQAFTASTVDASVRSTFINNILQKCVDLGYDGADVDWEDNVVVSQLVDFVEELRLAADAHPNWANDRFVVTYPNRVLNMNTDTVQAYEVQLGNMVDYFSIMSYGHNYAPWGWASWFFGALMDGGPGTHPIAIKNSIDAFVAGGIPRSKIGMGIGLYGDGYAADGFWDMRVPNATWVWGKDDNIDHFRRIYYSGVLDYGEYVFDEVAQTGFYRYNPRYPYARWNGATPINISILTFEDQQSIQAKGTWAKGGGCGGTIVWAYNLGLVTVNGINRSLPMEWIRDAFLV